MKNNIYSLGSLSQFANQNVFASKFIYLILMLGMFRGMYAQQLSASWMGGDTVAAHYASFGEKGIGGLQLGQTSWGASWQTSDGSFYVFGGGYPDNSPLGLSFNNRLYKYEKGAWTWVNGPETNFTIDWATFSFTGCEAHYGQMGVPSPQNIPGGRIHAASWEGPNDELYLYGGLGMDGSNDIGTLGDLWVYENGMWTWLSGSDVSEMSPFYGIMGEAMPMTNPGSRSGAVGWCDEQGDVYIFGGEHYGGCYGSTFKWDGSMWTYLHGNFSTNQAGSIANGEPAGRKNAGLAKTSDGRVFLHGGDQNTFGTHFGDLWEWTGSSWTYINGSINPGAEIESTMFPPYNPGSLSEHAFFAVDTTLFIYGGLYSPSSQNYGDLRSRLWRWDGSSWVFVQESMMGTGSYTSGNTYPGNLYSAQVAGGQNGAFFFGGISSNAGNGSGTEDLFFFDGNQFTYLYGSNGGTGTTYLPEPGASSNWPGGLYRAASDYNNSWNELYVFGGIQYQTTGYRGLSNVLWKFDGLEWVWLTGDTLLGAQAVYGVKGVASKFNTPGPREEATLWVDANNVVWLFGGNGVDAQGDTGLLNDLWKYQYGDWTWVAGSNTIESQGVYGQLGLASSNNIPSARSAAEVWTDNMGNAYLFGGFCVSQSGQQGRLNDFWKFDGTNWTWVSGSSSLHQVGTYGTKGVASSSNIPGARSNYIIAQADNGFYIYGGQGVNASGTFGYLNELWFCDGVNWTFLSGDEFQINVDPVYGLATDNTASVKPGNLRSGVAWVFRGNLYMFGGVRAYPNGQYSFTNNLWHWDGANWAWLKGGQDNPANIQVAAINKGYEEGFQFHPSALEEAVAWQTNDRCYLLGGRGLDQTLNMNASLNALWGFDFGVYYENGYWSPAAPGSLIKSAQILSPLPTYWNMRCLDLLVDANTTFNGAADIELYGDFYNYGNCSWGGNWNFKGNNQSIYGDTLKAPALLVVDSGTVLNTNNLLRIQAFSANYYGQLLNLGQVNGLVEFEYYLQLPFGSNNGRYFQLGMVLDNVQAGSLGQGGYFSTGVANASANTLWSWDAANAQWLSPDASSVLEPGNGFSVYAGNNAYGNFLHASGSSGVLRISGYAINEAEVQVNLHYNNGQNSGAGFVGGTKTVATEGWNLIANPYPHNVDVKDLLGDFTNQSIYIWDGLSYKNYVNGVSINGGTTILAPGQAFYFQKSGNKLVFEPGQFTFPKKGIQRSSSSAQRFKSAGASDMIKVHLFTSDSIYDEAALCFDSHASQGFDGNIESWKMLSANQPAQLGFPSEAGVLAVASMRSDSAYSIPLYVKADAGANLKWKFDLSQLQSWGLVYFEDRYLDQRLTVGPDFDYSFLYDEQTCQDRFFIGFSPISLDASSETLSNELQWFAQGDVVKLVFGTDLLDGINDLSVIVYSASGQLIETYSDLGQESLEILNGASRGAYLVAFVKNGIKVNQTRVVK